MTAIPMGWLSTVFDHAAPIAATACVAIAVGMTVTSRRVVSLSRRSKAIFESETTRLEGEARARADQVEQILRVRAEGEAAAGLILATDPAVAALIRANGSGAISYYADLPKGGRLAIRLHDRQGGHSPSLSPATTVALETLIRRISGAAVDWEIKGAVEVTPASATLRAAMNARGGLTVCAGAQAVRRLRAMRQYGLARLICQQARATARDSGA